MATDGGRGLGESVTDGAAAPIEVVREQPRVPIRGGTVCRGCGAELELEMVDLGESPLCESFLPAARLAEEEPTYPLHVRVCQHCWLAQVPDLVAREEIFTEYAYFSAYSTSWVEHAQRYVDTMVARLRLGPGNLVVELGSNDGYLLQHFHMHDVPVLGVDPARNVAQAAAERGVETVTEFFGAALAGRLVRERGHADLIVGNNVLAQVPDLHDFLTGVSILLAGGGRATFEFPHLARLLAGLQYDTIYHEHFSYFSLFSARQALAAHELEVVAVEELPTHGGSLRVHAMPKGAGVEPSVGALLAREEAEGLRDPATYRRFAREVLASGRALREQLVLLRSDGKKVVGYGAPGKSNTLLNYCRIGPDLVEFTVDRNPYKHGLFTPGMHIPIHPPEALDEARPDVILVLPWNLADEISAQLAHTAQWGARLLLPVPYPTFREPGS